MNNLNLVTGKANKTLVGNIKGFRYPYISFLPVYKGYSLQGKRNRNPLKFYLI